MKIKVQILDYVSSSATINSGIKKENEVVTFIAFSDTMKARILENFLKSPLKIGISIFDGEAKTGEWHEEINDQNIYNK